MEKKNRYYCTDCHEYVDKNHRCQQWDTVSIIPVEAIEDFESKIDRLTKVNRSLRDSIDALIKERDEPYEELMSTETRCLRPKETKYEKWKTDRET